MKTKQIASHIDMVPTPGGYRLSAKKIDQVVDILYKKHASGVQFDIFDVGKVLDAPRRILVATNSGGAIDLPGAQAAILAAITAYRKN